MMAAFIEYVYAGQAVDLTAPAGSWFFAPGGQPTDDQVLALAEAFGVQGDVRDVPADMGGGRAVGSIDYSEPSITVGSDATLSWWYNPGASVSPTMSACAYAEPAVDVGADSAMPTDSTPVASTAVDSLPVCPEPVPPANVPTAEQAAAKATELLVALGLQPGDFEFETYADEWSASVTAYLVLDGARTPMSVNVGYGADGAVTWAGGFLGVPQRGGDYPRIGVEAAVQRLNDQQAGWSMYGSDVLRTEAGAATVDAPLPAPDTGAPTDAGVSEPSVPPSMEPITVTLTNPRPTLEQLWATDGTIWLLPGYGFDSTDGGRYTVMAVEDQYIAVDDTPLPTPEPQIPEPQIPEQSVPDQPVSSAGCASATVPIADPTTAVSTDTVDGTQWIGLCTNDAIKAAEALGYQMPRRPRGRRRSAGHDGLRREQVQRRGHQRRCHRSRLRRLICDLAQSVTSRVPY